MMDALMLLISLFVFSGIGGWLSRMCGGGWPKLEYGMDQWLYALPYFAVFVIDGYTIQNVGFGLLAYLAAVAGTRTGHGQYLSLGRWRQDPKKGQMDEKLDFIVRFFYGYQTRPNRARDIFGLVVTGLAVTLLAGILLAVQGHFTAGILVVISGALKPLGYMLEDAHSKFTGVKYTTTLGEFERGVTGWCALACATFLM